MGGVAEAVTAVVPIETQVTNLRAEIDDLHDDLMKWIADNPVDESDPGDVSKLTARKELLEASVHERNSALQVIINMQTLKDMLTDGADGIIKLYEDMLAAHEALIAQNSANRVAAQAASDADIAEYEQSRASDLRALEERHRADEAVRAEALRLDGELKAARAAQSQADLDALNTYKADQATANAKVVAAKDASRTAELAKYTLAQESIRDENLKTRAAEDAAALAKYVADAQTAFAAEEARRKTSFDDDLATKKAAYESDLASAADALTTAEDAKEDALSKLNKDNADAMEAILASIKTQEAAIVKLGQSFDEAGRALDN